MLHAGASCACMAAAQAGTGHMAGMAMQRLEVHSLHHVSTTRSDLLAGLAAPDAHSHALHSELQAERCGKQGGKRVSRAMAPMPHAWCGMQASHDWAHAAAAAVPAAEGAPPPGKSNSKWPPPPPLLASRGAAAPLPPGLLLAPPWHPQHAGPARLPSNAGQAMHAYIFSMMTPLRMPPGWRSRPHAAPGASPCRKSCRSTASAG